jgi:N-acetylneuraminate lyase
MNSRLKGLIAATYTPLHADGSLNLSVIPAYVDFLISRGVRGLYVCGSTGEGISLTGAERRQLAQAFVEANAGRVPVIVQVGHNSLEEARSLAEHAAQIGADVVSATCPFYFKPSSVDLLIDSMAHVAAGAADLPFYYYHIPMMTGVQLNMVRFLESAGDRIPSLVGLKYTATTVHEFQSCLMAAGGRYDMLWGCDEMLLSALVVGAEGAVGSTYNIAAPIYTHIIDAFQHGDLQSAREWQARSVAFIETMCRYPFHSATKCVLTHLGFEFGNCRLPQPAMTDQQQTAMLGDLEALGFFNWISTTNSFSH